MTRHNLVVAMLFAMTFVSDAQIVGPLNKYYTGYDDSLNIETFKIRGVFFTFDNEGNCQINNKHFRVCAEDSVAEFEIYKGRYLFASVYKREQFTSPMSLDMKYKDVLIVYDLKEPFRKWKFRLWNLYNSHSIRKFLPKHSKLKISVKEIMIASQS